MPAIINNNPLHSKSHKIDYVKLVTEYKEYDITSFIVEIVLFEDIQDDAINGDIVLTDSKNLLSTLPVIGREKIIISFSSRDDNGKYFDSYIKTFKLIAPTGIQTDLLNGAETYKFSIVTEAYAKNDKIKISKSYNTTPDKIVTDLMNTIDEEVAVEECLYKRNFIIPNTTPFSFIKFLCDESTSKVNESSDFVFFENIDGFNFKSVYTLMKQDPTHVIEYKLNTLNNKDYRLNARHISIDKYFNALDYYNGVCGSKIITHDPIKKKQIIGTTDYYTFKNEFPNMNKGNLFIDDTFPQEKNSKIIYDVADSVYSLHGNSFINQRLKRLNNRALLNGSKVTIVLSGNIDIKTGTVIYVFYRDEFDKPDLLRSGNYIVTKIKHDITKAEYLMTIECSKDSYIPTSKKLS